MNSTELIKEALESYNNYEDGKFEKKSYMNGYYDARLKVSQMQLPVKPEIAEAYNKGKEDAIEEVIKQLESHLQNGNIDFITVSIGWVENLFRKSLKRKQFSV